MIDPKFDHPKRGKNLHFLNQKEREALKAEIEELYNYFPKSNAFWKELENESAAKELNYYIRNGNMEGVRQTLIKRGKEVPKEHLIYYLKNRLDPIFYSSHPDIGISKFLTLFLLFDRIPSNDEIYNMSNH